MRGQFLRRRRAWKKGTFIMHCRPISRLTPPLGQTSAIGTIIEVLLALFFRNWDNFSTVLTNLQKFYAKIPNPSTTS
jgi:hypothetical protein